MNKRSLRPHNIKLKQAREPVTPLACATVAPVHSGRLTGYYAPLDQIARMKLSKSVLLEAYEGL